MSDEVWTNEDVSYAQEIRGTLTAGGIVDGWFLARKTALTPMKPLEGPATVETQEGDYELPEGWKGYVAVDTAGYPYPIEASEFERTYERA